MEQNKNSEPIANRHKVRSFYFGGPEGDRTLDLTDANRTRSQLRYGPTLIFDRR